MEKDSASVMKAVGIGIHNVCVWGGGALVSRQERACQSDDNLGWC